ncbi:MAG TPA: DUF423 domain-containing protein [Gemmatimonadales bacterium]
MTRDRDARWGATGAALAGLAVAAGAFGAHALRARLEPAALEVWETAARYQMYHGLALLVSTSRLISHPGLQRAARWLFLGGTVLFGGSLYALALTGATALGAITPFGGVALIAGWGCLALALLRPRHHPAATR